MDKAYASDKLIPATFQYSINLRTTVLLTPSKSNSRRYIYSSIRNPTAANLLVPPQPENKAELPAAPSLNPKAATAAYRIPPDPVMVMSCHFAPELGLILTRS